jgi:hypothetical protein
MERIVADGIQVLIPPDSSRRKAPRPGWDGGLYAFMRRVLDTDHGSKLYRERKQLIEPRADPECGWRRPSGFGPRPRGLGYLYHARRK